MPDVLKASVLDELKTPTVATIGLPSGVMEPVVATKPRPADPGLMARRFDVSVNEWGCNKSKSTENPEEAVSKVDVHRTTLPFPDSEFTVTFVS